MTVNAIIAEYNPLHNGHVFQMENAKRTCGADYTIALMSGNFVQRGAPAIIDKHTRTKMALESGVDLVLELPTIYSSSSAEFFATGALDILSRLGVVDNLCFGSECGDVGLLEEIAEILIDEPEPFKVALKDGLESGKSYPLARNEALFKYQPHLMNHADILNSPNNILAIEYIKAIKRKDLSIKPFTTPRMGNAYHSSYLGGSFASAQAIRGALLSDQPADNFMTQIPGDASKTLAEYLKVYKPVTSNDFSDMLYYRLLSKAQGGYTSYLDISPDLSNRICNELPNYQSFDQFCDLLKTKEITYARIARCMMHILLDMRTEELTSPASKLSFVRVLGFKKESSDLLSAIDNNTSLKLITKVASAKDILSTDGYEVFEKQLFRDSIFEYIKAKKVGCTPANEYTTPITIV